MGEVVDLNVSTTLPLPPEKVLQAAIDHGLTTGVVLGWDKGDLLYIASSTGDMGEIILLLEIAKRQLLDTLNEV